MSEQKRISGFALIHRVGKEGVSVILNNELLIAKDGHRKAIPGQWASVIATRTSCRIIQILKVNPVTTTINENGCELATNFVVINECLVYSQILGQVKVSHDCLNVIREAKPGTFVYGTAKFGVDFKLVLITAEIRAFPTFEQLTSNFNDELGSSNQEETAETYAELVENESFENTEIEQNNEVTPSSSPAEIMLSREMYNKERLTPAEMTALRNSRPQSVVTTEQAKPISAVPFATSAPRFKPRKALQRPWNGTINEETDSRQGLPHSHNGCSTSQTSRSSYDSHYWQQSQQLLIEASEHASLPQSQNGTPTADVTDWQDDLDMGLRLRHSAPLPSAGGLGTNGETLNIVETQKHESESWSIEQQQWIHDTMTNNSSKKVTPDTAKNLINSSVINGLPDSTDPLIQQNETNVEIPPRPSNRVPRSSTINASLPVSEQLHVHISSSSQSCGLEHMLKNSYITKSINSEMSDISVDEFLQENAKTITRHTLPAIHPMSLTVVRQSLTPQPLQQSIQHNYLKQQGLILSNDGTTTILFLVHNSQLAYQQDSCPFPPGTICHTHFWKLLDEEKPLPFIEYYSVLEEIDNSLQKAFPQVMFNEDNFYVCNVKLHYHHKTLQKFTNGFFINAPVFGTVFVPDEFASALQQSNSATVTLKFSVVNEHNIISFWMITKDVKSTKDTQKTSIMNHAGTFSNAYIAGDDVMKHPELNPVIAYCVPDRHSTLPLVNERYPLQINNRLDASVVFLHHDDS